MWALLRRLVPPALSFSALTLSVAVSLGDDIPWRPSGSVTPVAGSSPAPTAQPARFVTLARPQPIMAQPAAATETPPSSSGARRLTPVVRAKADEESRPLPQAPSTKFDLSGDDILFQPARPQLIQVVPAQPKGKVESPTAPREETIPNQPRLVPQPVPYEVQGNPTPVLNDGTTWDITNGTFNCGECSGSLAACDTCNACNPCAPCAAGLGGFCYPRGRFWIRGEYLLWTFRTPQTPPLVTQSNMANPDVNAASLGRADTQILYGGAGGFNNLMRSGGRLSFGFWLPNHDDWGLDFGALFLGKRTTHFSAGSPGTPVLGRPFIDITGKESVEPVATTNAVVGGDPGFLLRGNVNVDYSSSMWGLEANLRKKAWCGPDWHVDVFFGYRHLRLEESLRIQENLATVLEPGLILNNVVVDQFSTRNVFNGGQVGVEGEWRFYRRWFLAGNVKVAVGNMQQVVNISGSQVFTTSPASNTVTFPVGVFAGATNIGRHERNMLVFMPEANLKVGLDITDQLRIFVGYNFLYINNVMRPGDAYDRTVNADRIPNVSVSGGAISPAPGSMTGPARPALFFRGSDFWAQGLNAGLEYHY